MKTIKTKMKTIRIRMKTIKTKMKTIRTRMKTIKTKMKTIRTRMKAWEPKPKAIKVWAIYLKKDKSLLVPARLNMIMQSIAYRDRCVRVRVIRCSSKTRHLRFVFLEDSSRKPKSARPHRSATPQRAEMGPEVGLNSLCLTNHPTVTLTLQKTRVYIT